MKLRARILAIENIRTQGIFFCFPQTCLQWARKVASCATGFRSASAPHSLVWLSRSSGQVYWRWTSKRGESWQGRSVVSAREGVWGSVSTNGVCRWWCPPSCWGIWITSGVLNLTLQFFFSEKNKSFMSKHASHRSLPIPYSCHPEVSIKRKIENNAWEITNISAKQQTSLIFQSTLLTLLPI
jgi:hypothetical protein